MNKAYNFVEKVYCHFLYNIYNIIVTFTFNYEQQAYYNHRTISLKSTKIQAK